MMGEKKLVPKRRFEEFNGDWYQEILGEVVEITMGQSPNSANYTDNPTNHILVQGNADLKNNKVVPRVWTTEITKMAKKDDLILSVRAPVGDIGKTDYEVVLGRGVAGIHGNEFIYQLLTKMKKNKYWDNLSTGSTFESINSHDIKLANILIPDAKEQQKIGQFFKHLDEMIAIQQRKIDKTKALKSAYLAEMFPAEGERVPKRRFAGFTDEWEKNDLGKLGIIQSGIGFPEKDQGGKKGIPFIKVSDMNIPGNEIELIRTNHYVNQKKIDEKRWHPITETPALIFAKVGAAIFLGRKRLINQPFLIDNNMMSYSFNSFWDINFGKILFEKLNLSRYAQVGALPSLSASDIANIRISIPTKKEQQKIGQFFKHLDEMIATHQQKLEKLKATKQAYLHEMFV